MNFTNCSHVLKSSSFDYFFSVWKCKSLFLAQGHHNKPFSYCWIFELPSFFFSCSVNNDATNISVHSALLKLFWLIFIRYREGFPCGASGKEPTCQCRRHTFMIPGWGRPPGRGHGNPLQYSCLENPMDTRAWRAAVHRDARIGHDRSD